ncbi:hypothetical protein FHS55_002594 [Angulomicrobium tetraedrale]|uniref:Uncharacterized protein n=1 Tax=Ancylobacter tetraedralis TaxID=217068 RepID=A0A839ZB79_9HYPH|nr:hypothetical protein [Ancylobacter tetraedralis]MBB3771985.1 hypothetical protein [Ancylobacter tetraedralis]
MSDEFFRASGIDTNAGANNVFVWCRLNGQDSHVLVGSGHVVPAGSVFPPGIKAGQFSVVFPLPFDSSSETIIVTDDKDGKNRLPGVSIMPCVIRAGAGRAMTAAPAVLSVPAPRNNSHRPN